MEMEIDVTYMLMKNLLLRKVIINCNSSKSIKLFNNSHFMHQEINKKFLHPKTYHIELKNLKYTQI